MRDDLIHKLMACYEDYRAKTMEVNKELQKDTIDVEAIKKMLAERDRLIMTVGELQKSHEPLTKGIEEDSGSSPLMDNLKDKLRQIRSLDAENQELLKRRMDEKQVEFSNLQKGKKTFRAYSHADYVKGSYFIDKRK